MGQKINKNQHKKLILKINLIFLFSLILLSYCLADERKKDLDQLFSDLKTNNVDISNKAEKKIWDIWSTHPTNDDLTETLAKGSFFVNNNQLIKAIELFTDVINIDPKWAEAWNKRATVLYMIGEYQKSQNDINKVLELEKRHFGALAGQGLVNIKLKNYEKAIQSYQEAQKIYPSMKSPSIMIEEIKRLIKKQSI
tara:strand:- start:2834 stop:3421 length:588 start_codon:yes stop_codon:yes gene_type:complete